MNTPRRSFLKQTAAATLAGATAIELGFNAAAQPSEPASIAFLTGAGGNQVLQGIPARIRLFRESITFASAENTFEELDKKWKYSRFLVAIIKELNVRATGSDALSPEQIDSIAAFSDLDLIVKRGYIRSTFRGASGFEVRQVDQRIHQYEEVLEHFVPAIGKNLALFQKAATNWDTDQAEAWRRLYRSSIEAGKAAATPKALDSK